jgi:hypothetical protein
MYKMFRNLLCRIFCFKGMANVTKVTRPYFEKFINRTSVEATVLAGTMFNVMPRPGQVSI